MTGTTMNALAPFDFGGPHDMYKVAWVEPWEPEAGVRFYTDADKACEDYNTRTDGFDYVTLVAYDNTEGELTPVLRFRRRSPRL